MLLSSAIPEREEMEQLITYELRKRDGFLFWNGPVGKRKKSYYTLRAVSYTHLDVYKRQSSYRGFSRNRGNWWHGQSSDKNCQWHSLYSWFLLKRENALHSGAVSYTHLDVYKRQVSKGAQFI